MTEITVPVNIYRGLRRLMVATRLPGLEPQNIRLEVDAGRSLAWEGSNVPKIKHQVPAGTSEIESGEIHIPNDADWGTGTFTTVFKPDGLRSNDDVTSVMVSAPRFKIAATVNPSGGVPVLLGRADAALPFDHVTFRLPVDIDMSAHHTLQIQFANWHIVSATLDGEMLSMVPLATTH